MLIALSFQAETKRPARSSMIRFSSFQSASQLSSLPCAKKEAFMAHMPTDYDAESVQNLKPRITTYRMLWPKLCSSRQLAFMTTLCFPMQSLRKLHSCLLRPSISTLLPHSATLPVTERTVVWKDRVLHSHVEDRPTVHKTNDHWIFAHIEHYLVRLCLWSEI